MMKLTAQKIGSANSLQLIINKAVNKYKDIAFDSIQ